MKNISLIGLAAALMIASGATQAGEDKAGNVINQNLSKRPYQAAPGDSEAKKADNWEGATSVSKEAGGEKVSPTQYQQLRIRMLGQRPYMEGHKP